MKTIVFDTSPVISLAMNNLLWLLPELREHYGGEFLITTAVKAELVDKPLLGKRFKFEAMQVLKLVMDNALVVADEQVIEDKARFLLSLANNCFSAKGAYIKIVHYGEMSAVAASIVRHADAVIIDERTTRELIEHPERIAELMAKKLHTKVIINRESLQKLKQELRNLYVLRSSELVTVAFELGLLDCYLAEGEEKFISQPRKALIESVLWGVKLNGCALSNAEIGTIVKIER